MPMSSVPLVNQEHLQRGLLHLESLSQEEYGLTLHELLSDKGRTEPERLWRMGRLIGISVKEPFAYPQPIMHQFSETGARRSWQLDTTAVEQAGPSVWQYQLIRRLIDDRSLRTGTWLGPNPDWVAESLVLQAVQTGELPDDLGSQLAQMLHIAPNVAEAAAKRILTRTK